jgi:hypothetical protein
MPTNRLFSARARRYRHICEYPSFSVKSHSQTKGGKSDRPLTGKRTRGAWDRCKQTMLAATGCAHPNIDGGGAVAGVASQFSCRRITCQYLVCA